LPAQFWINQEQKCCPVYQLLPIGCIWQFVGAPIRDRRRAMHNIPNRTPESDAMSRDLKKRGFRFVGTTICYAFMQAVGMVNDHLTSCFRTRK
jgi:DNA-3-methyladenine glycosylase I